MPDAGGIDTNRVLLLGGPLHWRTIHVEPNRPEVLFADMAEQPLTLNRGIDDLDPIATVDLKVHRYTRAEPLAWRDRIVGWVFEYAGHT